MSKISINPQFGKVENTNHLKININDISIEGEIRVKIENSTHLVDAFIDKSNNYVLKDNYLYSSSTSVLEFYVNLNIPEYSSQSMVSLFANIEKKQEDGSYSVEEILPIIYHIENIEVIPFGGDINLLPSFVGEDEVCQIGINYSPESRVVVSVNDRKFNILTNSEGKGSIHFKSKIIFGENERTIRKFPVYFYLEEDNFTKKYFSGYNFNVMPSNIKAYADIDPRCSSLTYQQIQDWEAPDWCSETLCPDGTSPPCGTIPYIIIPPIDISTKKKEEGGAAEQSCDNFKVGLDNICRINRISSTKITNGMILHAYVGVDSDISEHDKGYNINRVFIAEDESSLNVRVIVNRDVIVSSKDSLDNFEIYVDWDIWNTFDDISLRDYKILFYNETIGYQSFDIIERKTDEYHDLGVLVVSSGTTQITINDWMFCVNAVIYESVLPTLGVSDISKLPFIEDENENIVQTLSVAISSNADYVDKNGTIYIYVVAEAYINNSFQLFLYSFSIAPGQSSLSSFFGWKQLTFNGNNRNPKAYVDKINNLNIFWESDRTGINQIYYGIAGPSYISKGNASISSSIDKQSEIIHMGTDSFDYLEDKILKKETGNEYISIPYYNTVDLFSSNDWTTLTKGNGGVSQSSSANWLDNLRISGTPVEDTAMASISLDQKFVLETDPSSVLPDFSQYNYQISFDLETEILQSENDELLKVWAGETLDSKMLDTLYDNWKDTFVVEVGSNGSNVPVYNSSGNKFTIGRQDNIYDRFIPLVGGYRTDGNLDDFKINFSVGNDNVRHFSLGLILEKSYFTATNIQTEEQVSTGYIPSIEHIIYTGKAKLILLLKSESTLPEEESDYTLVREFPFKIDVNTKNNIKIINSYSKMFYEETSDFLNVSQQDNYSRFICNVYMVLNDEPCFAESFVSDLSDKYRKFDIVFGFPNGGQYLTDKMMPYKSCVFDNVAVNMDFNEISITSPTFDFNENIISVPVGVKSLLELYTEDTNGNNEDVSINYFDNNYLLSLNLIEHSAINNEFIQSILTQEGVNRSLSCSNGICNDIHIVWESNRDKYWNIFYSNNIDKQIPFRLENKITNTESNSIMPSVDVNRNGTRIIAWQDNRDGNYNIYCARSLSGYECTQKNCEVNSLSNFDNSVESCLLDFDYTATATGLVHFAIDFYTDVSMTEIFITILSQDSFEGWSVDGVSFSDIQGVFLNIDDDYNISYVPQKNDNIFNQILYVKLRSIT